MKANERVMAVSHAEDDILYVFGEGEYLGDKCPADYPKEDQPGGWMGEAIVDLPNHTNPCIKLDNGDIVWGCECWWGPVNGKSMQNAKERYSKVVTKNIKEDRKAYEQAKEDKADSGTEEMA